MDLTWSDEQIEFRSMLRRMFLAPPEGGLWTNLVSAGLLGLTVDESLGGAGASAVDALILFEEAGRALVADPLFVAVALVAPILETTDDAAELLAPLVRGEKVFCLAWAGNTECYGLEAAALKGEFDVDELSDGVRLSGTRFLVPNLLEADVAIVLATSAVYLIELDARGVERRDRAAIDESRPLGDLVLLAAPARCVAHGEMVAANIRSTWHRGIVLAAAEAVGVAEAVLALAQTHAQERTQFGRRIGSFQAVAHPLADVYGDIEMTRSLAILVACQIDDGSVEAVDVAALAVTAGSLGVSACETVIQVHGGIGMTWESPLHRYYKRARYLRTLMGSPDVHRALIARHLSVPAK